MISFTACIVNQCFEAPLYVTVISAVAVVYMDSLCGRHSVNSAVVHLISECCHMLS